MMIKIHKTVASLFGIGYIKGGGTVAAAVCCVPWYLLGESESFGSVSIILTLMLTAIGVWTAQSVEADWGKDSGKVVIDEAAGMMISLLFVPPTLPYIITGFVLFRLLDITKPLLIRKTESLPGGWGVMLDDVIAGVYANLLLHTIMWLNIF